MLWISDFAVQVMLIDLQQDISEHFLRAFFHFLYIVTVSGNDYQIGGILKFFRLTIGIHQCRNILSRVGTGQRQYHRLVRLL